MTRACSSYLSVIRHVRWSRSRLVFRFFKALAAEGNGDLSLGAGWLQMSVMHRGGPFSPCEATQTIWEVNTPESPEVRTSFCPFPKSQQLKFYFHGRWSLPWATLP